MAAPEDAAARLTGVVGVRLARNGPVLFADGAGLAVAPGDVVVVETPTGSLQATLNPGASPPPQPSPARGAGEGRDALALLGEGDGVPRVDAEGQRQAANVGIVVIGTGQIVEDAVGIEVAGRVIRLASDEEARSFGSTGARAGLARHAQEAGMPDGWDSWLQPAGQEPAVTTDRMTSDGPTAGDFIRRLFPDPAPPRSRPRRDQRPRRGDG